MKVVNEVWRDPEFQKIQHGLRVATKEMHRNLQNMPNIANAIFKGTDIPDLANYPKKPTGPF